MFLSWSSWFQTFGMTETKDPIKTASLDDNLIKGGFMDVLSCQQLQTITSQKHIPMKTDISVMSSRLTAAENKAAAMQLQLEAAKAEQQLQKERWQNAERLITSKSLKTTTAGQFSSKAHEEPRALLLPVQTTQLASLVSRLASSEKQVEERETVLTALREELQLTKNKLDQVQEKTAGMFTYRPFSPAETETNSNV